MIAAKEVDKDEEWQKEFLKHKSKYDIKPRIKERVVPKKFKKIEIIVDKGKGIFAEKDNNIIILNCYFSLLEKKSFKLEKLPPLNKNETRDSSEEKERFYYVDSTDNTDYDLVGFTVNLEAYNKIDTKEPTKLSYIYKFKWKDIINERYYNEELTRVVFARLDGVDKKVNLFMSLQAFNFSKK